MADKGKLKVFLCHSSGDKPKVREIYRRLVTDGFDAWLDEEKLLPGQDWDLEIQKAVRESDAVVVCLSGGSITKAGYVQKEIRFALDVADEQPEGAIYLIPARLEECQVPTRLTKWHWVNLFETSGYQKLELSLKARANELGRQLGLSETDFIKIATKIAQVEGKINTSLLQRNLRIGYTHSSRLLDEMVAKGIIEMVGDTGILRKLVEPQMVTIPAGKFWMGSTKEQAERAIQDGADKNWVEYEQPQHEVELSEYFIGKYPVTNREYQVFIGETKSKAPQGWDGENYPAEKSDHPVVNLSWNDAQGYCTWLSQKTGENYRLPTEAEWEKAARGADGRTYPWGNDFGQKNANTAEMKLGDTSPVGQFSPQGDSPYGCADLSGNVWEWCADWFSENEYKNRQPGAKNPPGPQNGSSRVLRGGSFLNLRSDARCANRLRDYPNHFNWDCGFRVVVLPSLNLNSEK